MLWNILNFSCFFTDFKMLFVSIRSWLIGIRFVVSNEWEKLFTFFDGKPWGTCKLKSPIYLHNMISEINEHISYFFAVFNFFPFLFRNFAHTLFADWSCIYSPYIRFWTSSCLQSAYIYFWTLIAYLFRIYFLLNVDRVLIWNVLFIAETCSCIYSAYIYYCPLNKMWKNKISSLKNKLVSVSACICCRNLKKKMWKDILKCAISL